jgi:hypothetical protein
LAGLERGRDAGGQAGAEMVGVGPGLLVVAPNI